MSAYASFLLPSAQDLGPLESYLDFRDPQGRPVTKPYLGPVFSLDHSDYETSTQNKTSPKIAATNFAPNDYSQTSTTLWLGAALVAAVLL